MQIRESARLEELPAENVGVDHPHTQHDEAQQFADAEAWLDNLDPATTPAKDARHLREVAALRQRIAEAEQDIRAAVWAARANGDSWSAIGLALGTSRQAAFQRFGDPDPDLFPKLMEAVDRGDGHGAERVLAEMVKRGHADSQLAAMVRRRIARTAG